MTITRNVYVWVSRLVLAVAFAAMTAATSAALTLTLPPVDVKLDRVTAKEIRTDGGRVAGWDVSVNLSKKPRGWECGRRGPGDEPVELPHHQHQHGLDCKNLRGNSHPDQRLFDAG